MKIIEKSTTLQLTQIEKELLIDYISQEKQILTSNLYLNIMAGFYRYPKPYGFFTKLGHSIKKTPSQGRQIFAKMERELYLKTLQIPKMDYRLFLNLCGYRNSQKSESDQNEIRSKRQNKESPVVSNEMNNLKEKENLKDFTKRDLMNEPNIRKERLRIMNSFLAKKIQVKFQNEGRKNHLHNQTDQKRFIIGIVKKIISESMTKTIIKKRKKRKNLQVIINWLSYLE